MDERRFRLIQEEINREFGRRDHFQQAYKRVWSMLDDAKRRWEAGVLLQGLR